MRYHVFKGKTAWVISKSQRMEITPFLDDSTSRIELKQKWSFLDSNRKELSAANHELKKGKVLTLILRIPEGAKILQVEELNMKNEIRFYGDTPFCINSTQFTSNNSVKSL